jgi:hypothetical protein
MATRRQHQLDRAVQCALTLLGEHVTTEYLIATVSERTSADPREIIDAVSAVNCRQNSLFQK